MSKALQRFTIFDLMIISLMATIGIALKPIIVPLAHLVTGPLMIPSGAFAGGFYMLWLVVGFGIVGKYGTGTLIAFVQALLIILVGVAGSHGLMSLFSYTLPGIMMDVVLFLIGHRVCCKPCAFIAGAVANVTGTAAVNVIFFRLPWPFLILTLSVALLSGGLGGLLAFQLLKILRKYRIVNKPIEEDYYAGQEENSDQQ